MFTMMEVLEHCYDETSLAARNMRRTCTERFPLPLTVVCLALAELLNILPRNMYLRDGHDGGLGVSITYSFGK